MKKILLFAVSLLMILGINSEAKSQSTVKGTVYFKGEPAVAVTIQAHKGGEFYTSFDGKFEIEISKKSKYIKFTYQGVTKKYEDKITSTLDFYFDGISPDSESGVVLKTLSELKEDREFLVGLSLYSEHYKNKSYKNALPYWRKIYKKYPKSTKNIYIHGATMYKTFALNTKVAKQREAYIDTLMSIYDRRIEYFGYKGDVLGRKISDYRQVHLDGALEYNVTEFLFNVIEMCRNATVKGQITQGVLISQMSSIAELLALREVEPEKVVEIYNQSMSNLSKLKETKTKEKTSSTLNQIFRLSGAASCEVLVEMYSKKFSESPSDIKNLKYILKGLGSSNCRDSKLYSDILEKVYKLEPTPSLAYSMAKKFQLKKDAAKVKLYLNEVIKLGDRELKAKAYSDLSRLLLSEKKYPAARNYISKAINLMPKNGEFHLIEGLIYVGAAPNFSKNQFEKSALYWLAVDCFLKAKKVDASVKKDADKYIKSYSQHYPKNEDIFFNLLIEGSDYKIEGWINKTAKVKLGKN